MSIDGSIPACAGEPQPVTRPSSRLPVYPRVCGGTKCEPANHHEALGLSPRVRGNRHVPQANVRRLGSIPACAGEPSTSIGSPPMSSVYPRVCGGTSGVCVQWGCGLVYPRVCGGTQQAITSCPAAEGLSPRVRGNPEAVVNRLDSTRSIPACAGEPAANHGSRYAGRVYPRVCGGTSATWCGELAGRGLSPRVRGNQLGASQVGTGQGSIPACAGEPGGANLEPPGRRVYPRVCGGTWGGIVAKAPL